MSACWSTSILPRASRSPSSAARPRANPLLARLAPTGRLPDPRHAHHPPAERPLPRRTHRRVKPGARCSGQIDVQGTTQTITTSSRAGSANIPSSGSGCTGGGGDGERHLPVFTRVQSRLMIRCVAGSRAVMTNSRFMRRLVRIDVLVVDDLWLDQLLARQIAVGVGQEVGILRRNLRPIEIVDQLIGLGDVLRIAPGSPDCRRTSARPPSGWRSRSRRRSWPPRRGCAPA